MSRHDDIVRYLSDPGYTPARTDLTLLVRMLPELSEQQAKQAQRVLVRAGWPAAAVVIAELEATQNPELVGLLGRFAAAHADARLRPPLLAALAGTSAKGRRLAATALGKLGDSSAEEALLAAFEAAPLDLARAIAEALGKLGSERALAALTARRDRDPEFTRRKDQALLLIERRLGRDESCEITLDAPLPAPVTVRVACRRGLSRLVADELSNFGASVKSDSCVELRYAGTLGALLVSRSALSFGFALGNAGPVAERPRRIAELLSAPDTRAAICAWTRGRPRFRLDWLERGHQRAASWAVARALSELDSALVNDPRNASWVLEIGAGPDAPLRLRPVLEPDPRFSYRCRDVPAASHPTIAAALARTAGVDANDVVWDPFVGSGLELVERGLLGPYRKLVGSDLDARALSAARENLSAAKLGDFELVESDMRRAAIDDVTLIISNPPMGRRVARDGSLASLLEAFIDRVAATLVAHGRAVFLSPLPARTEAWARARGLICVREPSVDLGGFDAEIQVITRHR
jgi:predicted RNA methylase